MCQTELHERKRRRLVLLCLGCLLGLPLVAAHAVQSVTVSWNPSPTPNVRGYRIYYGTACHKYDNQIVVPSSTTNLVVWGLTNGQTYYFAARSIQSPTVQSDYSTELSYTLTPDASNQPPIFTKMVSSKIFVPGQNVSFATAALGTGTLKYQWNYNGQILPAATNSVLTLNNATADQVGTYSVTVSDDIGTTNSNPANLTMHVAAASTQAAATLTTVTGLATPNDSGNQYAFDVSGLAGDTYVVQASADMQTWTSVQTNIAPFTYVDTNVAANGQQFYRVLHQ